MTPWEAHQALDVLLEENARLEKENHRLRTELERLEGWRNALETVEF